MLVKPLVGVHYPGQVADLRAWFPDDAACLDYLDWLRWPGGFRCPHCGAAKGWPLADGRYSCGGCKRRVSVTAGTIFHGTRTPLSVWFEAAWQMVGPKSGVSAVDVQRTLGLGSYQTAWAMLHRFRSVMVVPGRDLLSGTVEMDETFIGGAKPGKRGRGAAGKVLVLGAVERAQRGKGFGRARLEVAPDAKTESLRVFLDANIAPGATVISDGLTSYPAALTTAGYGHEPVNVAASGLQAHEVLPGVHRLFALVKTWIEGTHQGRIEPDHLQSYLDEFVFRFNRRHATRRGLLFLRLLESAITAPPYYYRDMIANPRPRAKPPTPPGARNWPGTLSVDPLDRPWRRPK